METLIQFKDCKTSNFTVNFSVESGMALSLVTTGETETSTIMRLMTGSLITENGSVHILGNDMSKVSRHQLFDIRSDIGLLRQAPSLISNLKLWENITLPFIYRNSRLTDEVADRAMKYLERFGYDRNLMVMPAVLSNFEQHMVSFIRSAICKPRIMIYAGCLDNLSEDELAIFLEMDAELHSEHPSMASIYISSSTELQKRLPGTPTINLRQESRRTGRA